MREKIKEGCRGMSTKRILSVVLALVMVITLLPMNTLKVYADSTQTCITLSSDATFSIASSVKGWSGTIDYKLGDGNWSTWDGSSITSSQEGGTGDYKIQFRGKNNNGTVSNGHEWSITGENVKISGNIMSLLDYEDADHATMGDYCFWKLFNENSSIVDISGLTLPAETLKMCCYASMFRWCTGLTDISRLNLPANTLEYQCYQQMFQHCSSIETVMTELPATNLANQCYDAMFSECEKITTPPSLPAETLAYACYSEMFEDCTNLTSAPVLGATSLVGACYMEMFNGCSKLTKLPDLSHVTSVEGNYACSQMFGNCRSIQLSTSGTGDSWRLPATVTGANASDWNTNMFGSYGNYNPKVDGASLYSPELGKTYYYKTYTITKDTETNGTYTVSSTSATAGTEITITTSPATNYEVETITVKDASDNEIPVNDSKFILPASRLLQP